MKLNKRYILTGFLTFLVAMVAQFSFAQINKYPLDSDEKNTWFVAPQAEIGKDSTGVLKVGYNTTKWIKATVPGTVFTDYVNAGIEKDPNFGDNIYKVDKKKYDRNFWYRTAFKVPSGYQNGQKLWLNFEGVNRKADVYFNGTYLGKLDGFMDRGKFDISHLLDNTKENVLAVLVYWPQTPIPNYASPTYISSASWDWMPYVPGLLMGITDNVYLSTSGSVTLVDPWIRTKVPSLSKANLQLQVELSNTTGADKEGELIGVIQPGNITFSQKMKIEAYQQRTFTLDTGKFKQFIINNPKLWVQLIKLFLKDEKGNVLSDNFYWRSSAHNDYTQLNTLAPIKLNVTSKISTKGNQKVITAKIKNPSTEIAFAVKIQAVDAQTGERILPAMMNDDYFTLFKNESKDIEISFDAKLLTGNNYRLEVTPYNNRKR